MSHAFATAPRRLFYVWDLPTRAFHWLLAVLVFFLLATGFFAPENWLTFHRLAGYGLTLLLLLRVAWWACGPGYSRFSTLLRNAARFPSFLPALLRRQPPHYAGHNPAGSAMILILTATLAVLIGTGFVVEGGEEKVGILAGITSFATGARLHELHEVLAFFMLAFIGAHVAGVAVETILQKVPLVRGMITGSLPLPDDSLGWDSRQARPGNALALIAVFAAAGAYGVTRLLSLEPLGVATIPANAAYQKECGACHGAFHPTLLPASSWKLLMARLDDHFGEDASLPPATAGAIELFLVTHASESSDSKAANRFRAVSTSDPFSITRTPFWVRTHENIPPSTFKSAAVKASSNCQACHGDAAAGVFADSAIQIPPANDSGG